MNVHSGGFPGHQDPLPHARVLQSLVEASGVNRLGEGGNGADLGTRGTLEGSASPRRAGGHNAYGKDPCNTISELRHARREGSHKPGDADHLAAEQPHQVDTVLPGFKGSFLSKNASPGRFMPEEEKHQVVHAQRGQMIGPQVHGQDEEDQRNEQ